MPDAAEPHASPEPRPDVAADALIAPLSKAERLVSDWAADNRYYFDAPLHPNARADLASRIAKALETALKQQSGASEKPVRKAAKGEKA
jgi:hypothetical protein